MGRYHGLEVLVPGGCLGMRLAFFGLVLQLSVRLIGPISQIEAEQLCALATGFQAIFPTEHTWSKYGLHIAADES